MKSPKEPKEPKESKKAGKSAKPAPSGVVRPVRPAAGTRSHAEGARATAKGVRKKPAPGPEAPASLPKIKKLPPPPRSGTEKDSITPPKEHLVSAFASLRKAAPPKARAPEAEAGAGKPLFKRMAPSTLPRPAVAPAAELPGPSASGGVPPPAQDLAPQAAPPPPKADASEPKAPSRGAGPQHRAAPGTAAPARPKPPSAPFRPPARAPARPHAAPPPPKADETEPSLAPKRPSLKKIKVTTAVTVRELAEKMDVRVTDFIKKLMSQGVFATINQRLEEETAVLIAQDYGYDLEVAPLYQEAEIKSQVEVQDLPGSLKPRPPVVTVMGHVDHGKTSLLDAIRKAKVAEGEAGGITQHIGAYRVSTPKGNIVFLDTPGHEAFTAMRARGATATDIVVLVVSAADGVMPQTVEAIDHAKAAGVKILVAVNKIDLPGANPMQIRQELSPHGLVPEEWGGKTIFVDVSAKKRLNLEKLLEMILLEAELLEIKANPDRPGAGVVLEARLDPKRGVVATVLIQKGRVRLSDPFVAGLSHGKIKALTSDTGERLEEAGPSTPVEILGISGMAPQAGDAFNVISSERQAKDIAEKRRAVQRDEALRHQMHVSLSSLKSKAAKELRLVLKADAQGSVQAIRDTLEKLSTAEIKVRIMHAGVGNINESDILLAGASDAVVLAFHVEADSKAKAVAEHEGVEVRPYSIIYDLAEDVRAAMEGLLTPEIVSVVTGKLEIRQLFPVKGGHVAGCYVQEGRIQRGSAVRVVRAGAEVGQGKVSSLRRVREDVTEVDKGFECGVGLEGFSAFAKGDVLEVVTQEKRVRRLETKE